MIFSLPFAFLLFITGFGIELSSWNLIAALFASVLCGLLFYKRKKLKVPGYFRLYLLFLALMFLNSFWSADPDLTLKYLFLFAAGGVFWLYFFNSKNEKSEWLEKMIIVLGIIFSAFFITDKSVGEGPIEGLSLVFSSTRFQNHFHIGDYWLLPLLILFYRFPETKIKLVYLTLIILGVVILIVSESRASYLALLSGVVYIGAKKGFLNKHKKVVGVTFVLTLMLFFAVAFRKSLIFSRPYYFQAILGFIHNPLGVGLGNFGIISNNPENHILGLNSHSIYAHNIILEIFTGMGVFGFVFLIWLIKVAADVIRKSDKKTLIYESLFLALTVNYLFDYTYFIPTMLWLWFANLGLSNKS